ncbi:transforming acidic coiled-coil protein [Anaeramoeba flamelloides]|uniref:Transforming acidic coiled-coil protein n=1 Tax=Anaeramoeba flamelloides TaxID=1746091 RepID=A0AAV7ZDB3_9EUKA|nr:transforming acidic coiled-coil protein isoform k [Anaeramoeba flamelloides]KAJ6247912.1 transforming acidic coiled-coil protein [Anaeramoeba flamelloides]
MNKRQEIINLLTKRLELEQKRFLGLISERRKLQKNLDMSEMEIKKELGVGFENQNEQFEKENKSLQKELELSEEVMLRMRGEIDQLIKKNSTIQENIKNLQQYHQQTTKELKVSEKKYLKLKIFAENKINDANDEIERETQSVARENKRLEQELIITQAKLKKTKNRNTSLQNKLELKKKENLKLVNLCEELISIREQQN